MTTCPSCQKSIEVSDAHLGTLFTCPHCNSVYFIDWNGQPEMAENEPEPILEPELEQEIETPQDFEAGTDFQGGADFQAGTDFQNPPVQDLSSFDNPREPGLDAEPSFGGEIPQNIPEEMRPQEDPYLAPAEEIPPGTEIETPYNFDQLVGAVSADSADFSDVTSFANANTAKGLLTYDVVIEGIESSRLLLQLQEAMTDSRFGWDAADLLTQVGGGRLILRGLSPAKASVLISRIKYLPFKISWRQDVLSSS